VNNLIEAQDIVMNSPMYKPNAIGPFGGRGDTWCNLSTYDVLEATGFHTEGLYNNRSARSTSANDATKNLIGMEKRGRVIEIKDPEEAQGKANEGYTVIVAWFNDRQPDAKGVCHGHLATIRPYNNYDKKVGPFIANIGSHVRESYVSRDFPEAFRDGTLKYYYDSNQNFYFDEKKMWCQGVPRK
jgi:hypothetical protein